MPIRWILPIVMIVGAGVLGGPATAPSTAPTTAPAAVAVDARIVQLVVSKPPLPDEQSLFPFGTGHPLMAKLALTIGQGTIIGVRGEKLTLTDDRGTDLFAAVAPQERNFDEILAGFESAGDVSEDRKTVALECNGAAPASGATSLRLKGEFVIVIGWQKTDQPAVNVELAKGVKFKAAGAEFTVDVSEGNQNPFTTGGNNYFADFEAKQDLPTLADFKFADAGGKEIKATSGMSSWSHMNGEKSAMRQYAFPKKLKQVQVIPTVWTKTQERPVSVDLTFGIGLKERGGK